MLSLCAHIEAFECRSVVRSWAEYACIPDSLSNLARTPHSKQLTLLLLPCSPILTNVLRRYVQAANQSK